MPTRALFILSIACSVLLTASCGPTQKVKRTLALNQLSLKARTAAANGDDQQALEHWQEYIERRPHAHFAEFNLGMTEARLGMYRSAIEHLTTAHDLRPGNVEYIEALADTYYAAGRTEDMMTLLQETSSEGEGSEGYLRLARYAQQAGLLDDAKQAIRSAMIFDKGESAAPYMAMADFARQISDKELELRSLRQALWFDRASDALDQRFLALGITPGPSLVLTPEYLMD
jgi:lipopolysaccharide biosynthesis regulator YciM